MLEMDKLEDLWGNLNFMVVEDQVIEITKSERCEEEMRVVPHQQILDGPDSR